MEEISMDSFWSALLGAGGTSIIMLGLSTWLGRVWANRILQTQKDAFAKNLESDKHEFAKALEEEKHKYSVLLEKASRDYDVHIEGLKSVLLRYSERQFDVYGELWISLCNLKKSMDELWAGVTTKKVKEFSTQLNEAKFNLEKTSLFIDDEHLNRIHNALYQLDEFAHGKGDLMRHINSRSTDAESERRCIIENNRYNKDEYDNLLRNLRSYFKSKISGT